MHIKKLSLTAAVLCCFVFAKAQFVNDYLQAADKYYARGDYYSAALYYEKYLSQGNVKSNSAGFNPYAVSASSNKKVTITSNSKQKIIYNLAESYRKLHFHEKALPYYEQAAGFDKATFPLARYYYAITLKALGKYDESATAFNIFLSDHTQQDNYTESARREIQSLDFIRQEMKRKDLGRYDVQKIGSLNAEGGTYAPVWLNEETLLFTSTRPDVTDKNKPNTNRLYQAAYNNAIAGTAVKTLIPQAGDIHQGVAAVTPNGNTLFLSRWQVVKDKKSAAIYSSKKSGGGWSEPVAVTQLNMPASNNQQPFVMADGKHLLFSSDRPGGAGGFDLWMADLDENGNPGNVTNLGSIVNTKYDEQAPGYHTASGTLVFSSNGRVGMGGFDFYYSKGELGSLTEPKNFGYPVNSLKDDLYFTSKGPATNILENVVMSSDRDDACCLELFSLNKTKSLKQISGTVLACDTRLPLGGVKVIIVDAGNKTIAEKMTDATGTYSFTIPEFEPLKATATNKGYFANSVNFIGPADAEEEMFNNPEICLNLIPEEAVRVENVFYDFNKATLQESSYPSLDKLVQLLNDNPTILIELGAHTDSKGEDDYNLKLSEARAKSVVDYLISKGISRSRLMAKGYGETVPAAENSNADGSDNPEGRQLNRRTEFKVLKN